MKNKLHLVQDSVFLTCNWVQTGDPKLPLACIWTVSKKPQAVTTASSTEELGRLHLCA